MFNSYSQDFGACKWFDEFHNVAGRTPLSQLGDIIDADVPCCNMAPRVEKPWGKPVDTSSFNKKYETEFRTSAIPDAGNGWWAKVDMGPGRLYGLLYK